MLQELTENKIWVRFGRIVAVITLLTACTPPVELCNKSGSVKGRQIELIAPNDQLSKAQKSVLLVHLGSAGIY